MNERVRHYGAKLGFETDSWDLFESLRNSKNVIGIAAQSEEAYEREHIPGALNIPHRTMSPEITTGLSKAVTGVTCCDGIGCNAYTKGALRLARLAFKVKEWLGGLDWRKRDGYATEGTEGREGRTVSCGC